MLIFHVSNKKALTMSSNNTQEKIGQIFFTFTQVNKATQAQLFEEINKEIEAFLSKENNNTDSIDSIFDFLNQISDSVPEEFDELLKVTSATKLFFAIKQPLSC